MSVSHCLSGGGAGAHVTQCWAIDLLLAISRICCQDMLGIYATAAPRSLPSLSLSPFDIDYRKSISAACHMLICPVYGPTSFVRTFFVLSLLLGRTGCLFMPFNKFTLPAAVPNTCLLPLLLLLLLCLLYMPTNAILSCPTQHHMHLKLATPPLRLWNHYNSNCKRKSLMQSRILSRASLGLLSTKLQDPLSLSIHSLLKLRRIFHFI